MPCSAEFGNSLVNEKIKYLAKKKEKSRFIQAKTKDYNPGNRSGEAQELRHGSGGRDAVSHTFETKKL